MMSANGDFRADDGADAQLRARLREAYRASELVVVGERERRVAELFRALLE
jgi:hypothetical protein